MFYIECILYVQALETGQFLSEWQYILILQTMNLYCVNPLLY